MKRTCVLTPQSARIRYGKVRNNPDLPSEQIYEISEIDRGFLTNEAGLKVINTVSTLTKDRSITISIVNSTNKFIKIHRHGLLARILGIQESNLKTINTVIQSKDQDNKIDLKNIDVPDKYRSKIENLILKNQDLFASKDSELGHTDTVKMKIGTGTNDPIKIRPYRTPLKNRDIIDKAIDEMLDTNVIQRSRSPWSFPVVIVDKKGGSKRFCVDFRKLNQISKKKILSFAFDRYHLSSTWKCKIVFFFGFKKWFSFLLLQVLMDEKDKEKQLLLVTEGCMSSMLCHLVFQMHRQFSNS